MKTTAIAFLALIGAARTAEAHPQEVRDESHHCRFCITLYRWERQEVVEKRLVGYRDEMVEKMVTEYEERCVQKRVIVGYDCDGPIYEIRTVRERVPVCRTIRVCEKRPVYEDVVCHKWVKVPYTVCRKR